MAQDSFTETLRKWLEQPGSHTLQSLFDLTGERTLAVAIMMLMMPAALPIPTGGITHVFEVIAAVLCLRMALGRPGIGLPRRWRSVEAGGKTRGAINRMLTVIGWAERHSRMRWRALVDSDISRRVNALVMLVLTIAAFVAPPFSGLDTLPALGVVLVALAIVLHDALFVAAGIALGCAGIAIEFALGSSIARLFHM